MTWDDGQSRWKKMYRGKTYTVVPSTLNRPPTKLGSYQAANDWWLAKRRELDAPANVDAQVARFAEFLPPLDVEQRQAMATAHLLAALAKMPADFRHHAQQVLLSGDGETPSEALLTERAKAIAEKVTTPAPGTKAVAFHAEKWNELQLAANKSVARKKMNVHMLGFFTRYLGPTATVQEITEDKWESFYLWLNRQNEVGSNYQARVLSIAKNFTRYLYQKRLLPELPRNLDQFRFRVSTPEVRPAADQTVREFCEAATGQTKLHAYLMLNTGMNNQDVADLQDDEVDWQKGTITRKRSKTKDDKHTPTVTWKLWPRTFALLKEYRSGQARVLLTKTGKPWIQDQFTATAYKHSDSIASCFRNICQQSGLKLSPKELRKAAASKLAKHPQYKFYTQYFLAHSPKTVADKHYVEPSEAEFFRAIDWLEKQFFEK